MQIVLKCISKLNLFILMILNLLTKATSERILLYELAKHLKDNCPTHSFLLHSLKTIYLLD